MRLSHLCLGAALIGLAACNSATSKEVDADTIKTLAVTGVGELEVMPDSFVISGAVIKQKPTTTEAMNAVAEVINTAQDTLPKLPGMKDAEFSFATVNTNGVKDPECLLFNEEARRTNSTLREGERRVKLKVCEDVTQQASVTFTFTGAPVDLAGTAISKLSESGAVRVRLNGYRVSNIEEIELQAGERAIQNAREKADRMADAAGSTIKGVLNLNSYQPTYNQQAATAPRVQTSGAGESGRILEDDDGPKDVTEMNLTPGPQVISARVDLEFIYE